MSDLEAHSAAVAKFYKTLTECGVDEQVAGICTIDLNKVLLSRDAPSLTPDVESQRDEIAQAAAAKRAKREAELAAQ